MNRRTILVWSLISALVGALLAAGYAVKAVEEGLHASQQFVENFGGQARGTINISVDILGGLIVVRDGTFADGIDASKLAAPQISVQGLFGLVLAQGRENAYFWTAIIAAGAGALAGTIICLIVVASTAAIRRHNKKPAN